MSIHLIRICLNLVLQAGNVLEKYKNIRISLSLDIDACIYSKSYLFIYRKLVKSSGQNLSTILMIRDNNLKVIILSELLIEFTIENLIFR